MKGSYLNDSFFSRLEALALELRADLAGFFGGKHLVKTYGQSKVLVFQRLLQWCRRFLKRVSE